MSKSFSTITLETDDKGITTVTINRPKKLNALNDEVLNELADVFKDIQIDEAINAIIVKGAGDKAFVAGADIKELRELDNRSGRMASQKGQQIFQLIEDTRKPVIAAVNGYALGGGAELAMACHLRIAGENAVFGLPEVGLGLIPGYGGTQRLPGLIGKARALEMILTGKQIKAEEAHQLGLVNEVSSDPVKASKELLHNILKNGPLAVRNAIKAVYHSDHRSGYQVEADVFGELCETEDSMEGTSAFLEKRKPEFKGK
ncbi:enoyl-CoA hydratase/isomerase family protein [Fodinibius sp.]|uniref:enoyl-CoA hydratase/isomerase family protein n=1 Tax=Fodinibius sp. TaxID=1872440 RepID=UPI002ACEA88A|nr:enoyl-CoA hydratase-related protein [Fodinibius sp.]MDZ7658461.1 enoyl-CoA hydratase-related protein [Fodinibius sp.]